MRKSMTSDWRSQEPGTQGRRSTLKCAVDNWMGQVEDQLWGAGTVVLYLI